MKDAIIFQRQTNLLSVLLDVQNKHGYLPEDELEEIAMKYNVHLTQIYALATFYSAFTLNPKGKHTIKVCLGTACHVNGGQNILKRLKQTLEIDPGETTDDNLFTL